MLMDGFHYKNIDFTRDCFIDEYYDLRTVNEGEKCPECSSPLRIVKAIELGHIFKLGTKYSEALKAYFMDADSIEKPIIMGSYGIGVERILACFIEQNNDSHGIIWKKPLVPFDVHLIGLNLYKNEDVKQVCERLYDELIKARIDVLYDDRDENPGIKFNDADLIGIPLQLIAGKKNLDNGIIELKFRENGNRQLIKLENIINEIRNYI